MGSFLSFLAFIAVMLGVPQLIALVIVIAVVVPFSFLVAAVIERMGA